MAIKSIIEDKGIYRGFEYMAMLFSDGHRCGYVRINDEHPLHGKDVRELDVDCHGGLTFSKIVKVAQGDFSVGHWIGFDCAHYGDTYDFAAAAEAFGESKYLEFYKGLHAFDEGVVRTLYYVVDECEYIIRQLINKQG